MSNKPVVDDRSVLEGTYLVRKFAMYSGLCPLRVLYLRRRTLKSILCVIGRQCRAARTGVMCSLFFVLVNSQAAEF